MIRQGLSAFAPLSSERIEAAQERHGHAIPEYLKYLHTGDVLADELVQICGIFRKGLALTELLIEISPCGESQSLCVKMRSTYGSPALEVVSTHTGWHIPAVGGHHARRRSYVARRSQSRSWLSGPGLRRAGAWPPGRRRPGSGCCRRCLRDCPPVRSPVRRPCPGPARTPEGQGADRAAGLLDVVEGPFLGINVVEIGKSLRIRAEMGRRQGTLETVPPELLRLIGSPERFQRIDPGVRPREFVPGLLSHPGVLRRPAAVGGTQRPYQPVPCRFRHAWVRDNRSVGR